MPNVTWIMYPLLNETNNDLLSVLRYPIDVVSWAFSGLLLILFGIIYIVSSEKDLFGGVFFTFIACTFIGLGFFILQLIPASHYLMCLIGNVVMAFFVAKKPGE